MQLPWLCLVACRVCVLYMCVFVALTSFTVFTRDSMTVWWPCGKCPRPYTLSHTSIRGTRDHVTGILQGGLAWQPG